MPTRKQIRNGVAYRIVQLVKNPGEGEPKGKDLYDEVAAILEDIEATGYKTALTDMTKLLRKRSLEDDIVDEDVNDLLLAVLALPGVG